MDKKLEALLRCWNLDNIEYSDDLLDIDSNRKVVAEDVKKVIDSISNSDADSYFDLPEEIWEEFEIQPDDIVKALEEVKKCIVIDAVDSQSGKISYHFDSDISDNSDIAVDAADTVANSDISVDADIAVDNNRVDCYIKQLGTVRIQV